MSKEKYTPGNEVDLPQEFVVIAIPDDTLELEIAAKIYIDGELHEVTRHMDFPEVRSAIREARDGYIPSDALFTLTPTNAERITQLVERYRSGLEDDDEC